MCVAGSGGGTRYARLPPVIEMIPHSGYLTHVARLKGLKRLKGILAPGVSGYTPQLSAIHIAALSRPSDDYADTFRSPCINFG